MLDVIKVANESDVTVSTTETTKGVPDQDTVSLTLEGAVSMPFTVSTIDSVCYLSCVTRKYFFKISYQI